MATFRIVIIVDSKRGVAGIRNTRKELGALEASAKRLNRVLTTTFAGITTIAAVRQVVTLLDTFNSLENRLRVVTSGQAELNQVFDQLFQVAQRSRSSLTGTVELYSRLAVNARELGVNQQQLIQFTESLNKAIIVSGASFREANQGLIQLSQGLASGTLRGDELRSVLEQLPVVADIIAKELGVTRGELRALGAEGKITARDILTAFENAREEIEDRFAKTVPTISQAFQTLANEVVRVVGEFDNASGVTELLVQAIVFLRDNFETLFNTLVVLVPALAVRFAGGLLVAAGNAGILTTAVAALNLVLSKNPFVAVATAIALAIGALVQFGEGIKLFENQVTDLRDVGIATFQLLTESVAAFVNGALDLFNGFLNFLAPKITGIGDTFSVTFQDIINFAKLWADSTIGVFVSAFEAIILAGANLPAAFSAFATASANALVSILQGAINLIIAGINRLIGGLNGLGANFSAIAPADLSRLKLEYSEAGAEFGKELTESLRDNFDTSFIDSGTNAVLARAKELGDIRAEEEVFSQQVVAPKNNNNVDPTGTGGGGGGGGGGNRKTFADILRALEQENELLRLNRREREDLEAVLQAEKKIKRELNAEEKELLLSLLEQQRVLQARADILDSLQGAEEEVRVRQAAINQLYEEGAVSLRQYNDELNNLRVLSTQGDNSFLGGIANGLATVAAQANDFGSQISGFLVGAFDKASDAVVEFAKTGKFSFRDFFGDLSAQLLKLATNQLFAALFGGGGAALGGFGGFGGFGGGLFGGLGRGIGSLFGFQTGGSILPGGVGGPDSQVVTFRKSPDERVDILTPQQQRAQAQAMNQQQTPVVAPPANLQVAVVLSDEDIEGVFEGEAGDRLVIRGLERNPTTARRVVGA